jgi:hypothetical protein
MSKRRTAEPTQGRPVPKRLDHMAAGVSVRAFCRSSYLALIVGTQISDWGKRWSPVKKADVSSPTGGECNIFSVTGETSALALEHPHSTSTSHVESSSRRTSGRQRTSNASPPGTSSRPGTASGLHPPTTGAPIYVQGVLSSSPNLGHVTLPGAASSHGYPPLAVTPSPDGGPTWDEAMRSSGYPYPGSTWPQHPSFGAQTRSGTQDPRYEYQQSSAHPYSPTWPVETPVEQAYHSEYPGSYPQGMVAPYDPNSSSHTGYDIDAMPWVLPLANDIPGDPYGTLHHHRRGQTWGPEASPLPLPPMPVHAATLPSPSTPMGFFTGHPQGYPSPDPSSASSGSFAASQGRRSVAAVGAPRHSEVPIPRISQRTSSYTTGSQKHPYPQSTPGSSSPWR